jgi:BlaI family transcriptional regulator, penicillinase repressor
MQADPHDGAFMDPAALGDRELDVMTTLWQRSSGTVSEVQEALGVPLAYTTVLTILRNLETKGFLRREEEGRAHRYFPRVKQRAAQKRALRRLVDTIFAGSSTDLLTHLVDDHALSAADLRRMAEQLAERERQECDE